MSLRTKINEELKAAMKAKEAKRLATLRLINAAIKDRDIEARGDGNDEGVSDNEILAILGRMVKQRQESARSYEEGGRLGLAEGELEEIGIIEEFLPKKLSQEESALAIEKAIAEVGATSLREIGQVMGLLKSRYLGQMDFSAAGAEVKKRLG